MAVFFDTGDGDIYGGPTKADVLAAMKKDSDEVDTGSVFEVPGSMKMRVESEDGEDYTLSTLQDEYVEGLGSYWIASENC